MTAKQKKWNETESYYTYFLFALREGLLNNPYLKKDNTAYYRIIFEGREYKIKDSTQKGDMYKTTYIWLNKKWVDLYADDTDWEL